MGCRRLTFKEGLCLHHRKESERDPECPRAIQADDEVPHAERRLRGERGHEEAQEPVRGHEWHRERQRAQVRREHGAVQLHKLLRDLTIDSVADHRLHVVVGQDLLDEVAE